MTDFEDDPFPEATTVAHAAAHKVAVVSYPFVLTVVEGSDSGKGYSVAADHPTRVLMGKSEACELRLSVKGASVHGAYVKGTTTSTSPASSPAAAAGSVTSSETCRS